MTNEEAQILMIKGAITELTPESQALVYAAVESIKMAMKNAGEPMGAFAIALIGAEMQKESS